MQYNFYSFSLETRHLNWKDKTILWRNLARKKRKSNIWGNPTVWRHCARLLYLLACLSSVSVNKPFQRTLAQGKSRSKDLKSKIQNLKLSIARDSNSLAHCQISRRIDGVFRPNLAAHPNLTTLIFISHLSHRRLDYSRIKPGYRCPIFSSF